MRDHGATERLSALLAAAAEAPEEEGPGPGRGGGTPGPGDAPQRHPGRGGQHRHPVRVRHAMATPATVVLAAVLLIVCGLAAVSLTRGEPAATPVLEATARPVPTGPPPAGPAGESAVAAVPPPPGTSTGPAPQPGATPPGAGGPAAALTVHVTGEVRAPGVVEVPPGSRVVDAVEAAEGLTERAVTDHVNLAQPLADGQQVIIPDRETADAVATGQDAGRAPAAGPGPVPVAGAPADVPAPGTGTTPPAGPIDLNTATIAELETLPRVGPVLAQRIVDHRTRQGPFTAPEQLDEVSGIGPAMLEALLPLVTT